MADPYLYKSCIPASTSKSQRSDCGGWGFGLGNNVSNTGRGVNAEVERMAALCDADAPQRRAKYDRMRSTDAYKLARAADKRKRQKARRPGSVGL